MRTTRIFAVNHLSTFALLVLICASLSFANRTLAQSIADHPQQSQSATPDVRSEFPSTGPVFIDGITVTHGIMVTSEVVPTDGIIATDLALTPGAVTHGDVIKPATAR